MQTAWRRVAWVGVPLLFIGGAATAVADEVDSKAATTTLHVVAVITAGVGASLLASGLAAWLVYRQILGIDVAQAIEALRGVSQLARSNQSLTLTLTKQGTHIDVHAEHAFDLHGYFKTRRQVVFRLYSSIARWGTDGGFVSINEPDSTILQGETLSGYVHDEAGVMRFEKPYPFEASAPNRFVVETQASFRMVDRLFWAVDHISTDFKVRVNDCTNLRGSLEVKINHHRESSILENMKPMRATKLGNVMEFEFLGEVLPFQGFELQWRFQ